MLTHLGMMCLIEGIGDSLKMLIFTIDYVEISVSSHKCENQPSNLGELKQNKYT